MSELKVDTVVNLAGTGKPNFENGITINSAAPFSLNLNEYTESSSEPSSPSNGALWWDTANEKTFIYAEGEWKETIEAPATISWGGSRGIMAHGFTSSWVNTIDKFDITTSGNATDFGDLTVARAPNPTGSSARCCFGGGMTPTRVNVIDYITTSTAGNAIDFGDLTQDKSAMSTASNGTRGLWFGGYVQGASPTYENTNIDYITIDTLGNASDFGDTTVGSSSGAGCSNDTYGLHAGGYGRISGTGTYKQNIDKVVIATTGNATDYGDLTKAKNVQGGASDKTRGLIGGGYDPNLNGGSRTNEIEYVTIATDGNGTDFGDLSVARSCSAASHVTYAVFVAGEGTSGATNIIDRVTVQTLGNAADHGDLTSTSTRDGAWSGNAS